MSAADFPRFDDESFDAEISKLECFILRERTRSASGPERRLCLLATLSATKNALSTRQILESVQRYSDRYQSADDPEVKGSKDPLATLNRDISEINRDGNIIVNQGEKGMEALYVLNRQALYRSAARFTQNEVEWMEVALRFLEGDHTLLITRLKGASSLGESEAIDLDAKVLIPAVAQDLYRAIVARQRVRFSYQSLSESTPRQRYLEPWKLYFHRGYFYLQAHDPDRPQTEYHTYNLSRFTSQVSCEEPANAFTPPEVIEKVNLEYTLPQPLLVAVKPGKAQELRHYGELVAPPADASAPLPAGDWEFLEIADAPYFALTSLLREFLDQVVVLSPENIRQELLGHIAALGQVTGFTPAKTGVATAKKAQRRKVSKISKDNAALMSIEMIQLLHFLDNCRREGNDQVAVGDIADYFGWSQTEVRDYAMRLQMVGGGAGEMDERADIEVTPDSVSLLSEPPAWAYSDTVPASDAVPLLLALETLSAYIPAQSEVIREAERKVAQIILRTAETHLELLGIDSVPNVIEENIDKIWDAIEAGEALTFTYTNSSDETKDYVVFPHHIVAQMDRVYLHAVSETADSWRTFRLDRMSTPQVVKRPQPGKLPRRTHRRAKTLDVRLDVKAMPFIDRISECQILSREDEEMTVRFRVVDYSWLTRTLLSFGKLLRDVEVSPQFPDLVDDLHTAAQRAREHYGH